MKERKLTNKQERFCHEVIRQPDAAKAYRAAYDTKNMKIETIWNQASKMLRKPLVAARVAELKAKIEEKMVDKSAVSVEMIRSELLRHMRFDVRKLYKEDGTLKPVHELDDDTAAAISEISVEERQIVEDDEVAVLSSKVKKYKATDKLKSVQMLGQHLKMFTQTHEVTGKDGGAIEVETTSDQDLARWIAFQLSKGSK
jgi:phage terminase small subunit